MARYNLDCFKLWLLDQINCDFKTQYVLYSTDDKIYTNERLTRFDKSFFRVNCQKSFGVDKQIFESQNDDSYSNWCYEVVPKIEDSFSKKYSKDQIYENSIRSYCSEHKCFKILVASPQKNSMRKNYFTIDMNNFHHANHFDIADNLVNRDESTMAVTIFDDNYNFVKSVWTKLEVVCCKGTYYYCDIIQRKREDGYCYSCETNNLNLEKPLTYTCIDDIIKNYPPKCYRYILSNARLNENNLRVVLSNARVETFKNSHGISVEGLLNVLNEIKDSGVISFHTFTKSLFEVDDFEKENNCYYVETAPDDQSDQSDQSDVSDISDASDLSDLSELSEPAESDNSLPDLKNLFNSSNDEDNCESNIDRAPSDESDNDSNDFDGPTENEKITFERNYTSIYYTGLVTTARNFDIKNIEKLYIPNDHIIKTMFEIILFIGNFDKLNRGETINLIKFVRDIDINPVKFAGLSEKLREFLIKIISIPKHIYELRIMRALAMDFQIILDHGKRVVITRNISRNPQTSFEKRKHELNELPEHFMKSDISRNFEKKRFVKRLKQNSNDYSATEAMLKMINYQCDTDDEDFEKSKDHKFLRTQRSFLSSISQELSECSFKNGYYGRHDRNYQRNKYSEDD